METEQVQLEPKMIEQLRKQPIIETRTAMSDDRKWIIHKTIITDIKSINYLKEVMKQRE